jgi:hypothetical protein
VAIACEAELAFVTALAAPAMLATAPAADAATIGRFRDRLGFKLEDLDYVPVARERDETSSGRLARLQRHLFNERDNLSEAEPSSGLAGREL